MLSQKDNRLIVTDIKANIKDFFTKPPVVFPLVALFHLLLLILSVVSLISAPATATEIGAAWMLAYTLFWLAASTMRKWGAIGYILVTVADILTWYAVKDPHLRDFYNSSLFLISIVFSLFIVIYYRRFR